MLFPHHIERRYTRGKCLAFAIALKRETGLPIFVAIETLNKVDLWHHAFVADASRQRAYDVRGAMDFDVAQVTKGMGATGALRLQPATAAEIGRRMGVDPTPAEIHEARTLVRGVLARVYLEGRSPRSDLPRPRPAT